MFFVAGDDKHILKPNSKGKADMWKTLNVLKLPSVGDGLS